MSVNRVDCSDNTFDGTLHKPGILLKGEGSRALHWGQRHRPEGAQMQQRTPDAWVGPVGILRWRGFATLGDLGRHAQEHGAEAAIRLVAEACSRAA